MKDLSLLGHLEELRGRILKAFGIFILACVLVYQSIDPILDFVIKPVGKLVFTYPSEAFLARLALTCWGGLFVAFPYILYQIWQFVSLALTEKERKYVAIFLPLSLAFFVLGILFSYFVMVPVSMNFFLSFASESMVPMITVNQYVSYIGNMLFAFGIVFELPVVLLFLTKIGIATPAFLIHFRPYVIVTIFIVSAVLTPPDIISQLLMAIPLLILYELGIIASKVAYPVKEVKL